MAKNKRSMALAFVDPDEAPDLSTPRWKARFATVPVKRRRPKVERPKVSTTLRLDADVLEYFRSHGPGWQTRIKATLRSAIKKRSRRAA
ncbi:MAG TPA: BrnA antitoxin family protein [Reyranella sp.]|nr:BrnA antitoxin family protein [Reyranella sp.]